MARRSQFERELRDLHGDDFDVIDVDVGVRRSTRTRRFNQPAYVEPPKKTHPYVAFMDGVAKLFLFLLITGALLGLMLALMAFVGVVIWFACSIIFSLQDWACWTVTIGIEGLVVLYMILSRAG